MPGWTITDIPLLLALPLLLAASALFSGSETAIFSLRAHQIAELRRHHSAASKSALNLLTQPRMLLITLLLGNMLVNVLYFVISSILLLHIEITKAGILIPLLFGILSLIIIILLAEVAPKLVAARHAVRWVLTVSIPLLILHDFLLPVRAVIAGIIVTPVLRLFNPATKLRPEMKFPDLTEFLQVAHAKGGISRDEEQLLNDVITLSRLKTRDAMTPRVRMEAVNASKLNSPRFLEDIRQLHQRFIPVYDNSLDHITGIIDLLRIYDNIPAIKTIIDQPQFIPEIATLDQVLEHFKRTAAPCAIAVDEFGQTAGIISYDDVVDVVFGDRLESSDLEQPPIMLTALGLWHIDPAMNVYQFAESFNIRLDEQSVSTIGGLVVEKLAKTPVVNDHITLDNWTMRITEVDGPRIKSLTAELADSSKEIS